MKIKKILAGVLGFATLAASIPLASMGTVSYANAEDTTAEATEKKGLLTATDYCDKEYYFNEATILACFDTYSDPDTYLNSEYKDLDKYIYYMDSSEYDTYRYGWVVDVNGEQFIECSNSKYEYIAVKNGYMYSDGMVAYYLTKGITPSEDKPEWLCWQAFKYKYFNKPSILAVYESPEEFIQSEYYNNSYDNEYIGKSTYVNNDDINTLGGHKSHVGSQECDDVHIIVYKDNDSDDGIIYIDTAYSLDYYMARKGYVDNYTGCGYSDCTFKHGYYLSANLEPSDTKPEYISYDDAEKMIMEILRPTIVCLLSYDEYQKSEYYDSLYFDDYVKEHSDKDYYYIRYSSENEFKTSTTSTVYDEKSVDYLMATKGYIYNYDFRTYVLAKNRTDEIGLGTCVSLEDANEYYNKVNNKNMSSDNKNPSKPSTDKTDNKIDNKTQLVGDLNNDNSIDSKDAVIVLKDYAQALVSGSSAFKAAGDVNKDGKEDSKDAVKILRYYAETLAGVYKGNIADFK